MVDKPSTSDTRYLPQGGRAGQAILMTIGLLRERETHRPDRAEVGEETRET